MAEGRDSLGESRVGPPPPPRADPGRPPFFSVIITAYNRRRFLPAAIHSVLSQNTSRSEYEIIVVKNFADEESDRKIRENGVISIFREEKDLGIHLRAALDRARGEVVALLNDDDLWEPDKLRHAGARFLADPRLGFHATSYSVIDEDGRPAQRTRDRFSGLARFDARRDAVFEIGATSTPDQVAELVRANPGSDSTITIRTSILRRFQQELEELPSSVDTFMLTCGLLSGSSLMVEYVPLTRLRVHRGNMSRATDKSLPAYLEKYANTMDGFASATAHMMRMAQANNNPWVYGWLNRKNRSLSHFASMARGTLSRPAAARAMLEDIRAGGRSEGGMIGSEFLCLVSPKLAQSVNFLVGRRIAGG